MLATASCLLGWLRPATRWIDPPASLLGVAVVAGSLTALLGPVGFFLVAHLHDVPFEEERMRETFGPAFEKHADRVRRWL